MDGKELGYIKENSDICVSGHVRRWIIERSENKCEKCGWNERNSSTNKVPLQIHHKDGDSMNTTPDNIEHLCPNCHSLTPTFGNLNKGQGRKNRYRSNCNSVERV